MANLLEDDFPYLYHAHHSRHMEDLPFWLGLAELQGGSLLELGCGSGRILIPLAEAGYRVTGIEIDPGMLQVLRANLPEDLLPRVKLVEADFTDFQLGEEYRLVILPCNTYSTLDAALRQALLACVARCLPAGGVFVAGLPNPALLRQMPSYGDPEVEEVFPHPLDGRPVQVSSSWRRTAQGVTIAWDYQSESPDGQSRVIHREVRHQMVNVQTYLSELHRAGFTSVELIGDFDGSAYRRQSEHLILAAKFQPPE